jgi:hypothetical protein
MERPAALSDPLLTKEDRTATVEIDNDCNGRQHGRQQEQTGY